MRKCRTVKIHVLKSDNRMKRCIMLITRYAHLKKSVNRVYIVSLMTILLSLIIFKSFNYDIIYNFINI